MIYFKTRKSLYFFLLSPGYKKTKNPTYDDYLHYLQNEKEHSRGKDGYNGPEFFGLMETYIVRRTNVFNPFWRSCAHDDMYDLIWIDE